MRGERVLVACSGGRDSLALARVLSRLAPRSQFDIVGFVYVDHGPSRDERVVLYRQEARERVEEFAREHDIAFFVAGPSADELKSEAALRDFRHEALDRVAKETRATAIAFAHHADDLLETRLIRLMRGTGPTGLEAMSERRGLAWRPFLRETRSAISAYVSDQSIEWIEDPTNEETVSLRNWIRHELLPRLETRRAGAARSIARSFELIVDELARANSLELPREKAKPDPSINRSDFEKMALVERKRALTRYVSARGARALSSNQIDEVVKRLAGFEMQRRRSGAFNVAGLDWRVNSKEIVATPGAFTHDGN